MPENQREPDKNQMHASPEELSRLVHLVDLKGRIAVGAGLVLTVSILIWSLFGSLPEMVPGTGILVPPEGLMDVVALGQGQVTDIRVIPGERVSSGDVIAHVSMPELENERRSILSRLNDARVMTEERTSYYEQSLDTRSRNDQERTQQLRFRKEYLRDYFEFLKRHLAGLESLEHGFITPKEVETTRKTMQSVLAEINDCELSISEIEAKGLDLKSQAGLDELQNRERVTELEQSLKNVERNLRLLSRVVSPYDGVVVEVSAERGDYMAPGAPLASLRPEESALEAVVLFPVETGKKITQGMAAYIYPSTASREEYGCIYGLVSSVSEYPVSAKSLMKIIGTEHLIASLMEQGVMIMARISLLRDPESPSGFLWSSSQGPTEFGIEAGTVCQGGVVLRRVRPIDLVFPKFSRMLGLEK